MSISFSLVFNIDLYKLYVVFYSKVIEYPIIRIYFTEGNLIKYISAKDALNTNFNLVINYFDHNAVYYWRYGDTEEVLSDVSPEEFNNVETDIKLFLSIKNLVELANEKNI